MAGKVFAVFIIKGGFLESDAESFNVARISWLNFRSNGRTLIPANGREIGLA